MSVSCLIVDLRSIPSDDLKNEMENSSLADVAELVTVEEFFQVIEQRERCVLVLHADEMNDEIYSVLGAFQAHVGPVSAFQAVICRRPTPFFLSALFEFGLDCILRPEEWVEGCLGLVGQAERLYGDDVSEAKTALVMKAIRIAKQEGIKSAHNEMTPFRKYDYLAAYATGKAKEALGAFKGAAAAFKVSRTIYPHFRPASMSLCENLLITGESEEAMRILSEMERIHSGDINRKAMLIFGYTDTGKIEAAEETLKEMEALSSEHPKVWESRAQIFLAKGDIESAFKILDHIEEAGPLFAASLNEMGIKLSQAGKGKSALALYQKAHKIVRPELKYKISLNAALASHRVGDPGRALQYLDRTEKEYGSSFDKLDKIRSAVKQKIAGGAGAA